MYRKSYTVDSITEDTIILLDWENPRFHTILPKHEFSFLLGTIYPGGTMSITWDNESAAAAYTVPIGEENPRIN